MRKSTLGTHGVPPIRLDLSQRSPLMFGSVLSPTPFGLVSRRKLGSSKKKRVSPVRINQASLLEYSTLCSSRKKTAHTRRQLYKDYNAQRGVPTRPNADKVVPSNKHLRPPVSRPPVNRQPVNKPPINRAPVNRPPTNPDVQGTKIPKPGSQKQIPKLNRKSRRSSAVREWTVEAQIQKTNISNCNCQKNPDLNHDSLLEEMKKMLQEHGNMVSNMMEENKRFIEDAKKFFLDNISQFKNQNLLSNTSEQEEADANAATSRDKENKPTRKSLKEYKDMRTQFRCLQTPTLSAKKTRTPKTKTPRSTLSMRLQSQLECLFDES